MTSRQQPRLPGLGPGHGRLFAEPVLRRYLDEHNSTPLPGGDGGRSAIEGWVSALSQSSAGEMTLDPQFVQTILCGVLGYVAHPASPASLYAKPPTRITHARGTPDVVLGAFGDSGNLCSVVVELKEPGSSLDRPQPGYGNRTPVDQAFDYARETFQARWVIVSDMLLIRLYAIDSQDDCEEFDLRDCVGAGAGAVGRLQRLHFLLHHDYLVSGHDNSQVSRLYGKSAAERVELRAGFYDAYRRIRSDLYRAVAHACAASGADRDEVELLQATQRLLDRLMFLYYCEDHPQELIENGTIEEVTRAASRLPGPSTSKVYESLKALFREVDAGSPSGSGLELAAYDGGLFRDDPILDHIELPDSLHRKVYEARGARGRTRPIRGVWGLHVYDFWTELNEHLLGHIFEQSLSDLDAIVANGEAAQAERWKERRKHGVFYTTDILADFLSRSVLRSELDESAPLAASEQGESAKPLESRIQRLLGLKVVDFACGSGAFLVSMHREMVREFRRLSASLAALSAGEEDLFSAASAYRQSAIIRDCVFGADILPQAVEIAQLALWLGSVQKNQTLADLSSQVVCTDSLDVPGVFDRLQAEPGSFDIVIGNPPWGGEIAPDVLTRCTEALGLSQNEGWDSWELFLVLALRALRDGGRLALLLPDSFFYPEKARTRRLLFEAATVERVYSLGPDWFSSKVRMGTVAIQARRGPAPQDAEMRCTALSGELRRQAIRGEVQLSQMESLRSRTVRQHRTLASPTFDVEVLRGARDDRIISRMEETGIPLATLCERSRGEEINKAGLAWRCPNCGTLTAPGAKRKGGGYKAKKCPECGLNLTQNAVQTSSAVSACAPRADHATGFIDGVDIAVRYRRPSPEKSVDIARLLDAKSADVYAPPKILIREAGVGLLAALDETPSRCPRSVYIYRLRDEYAAAGYCHEFILAALLSRTMNYFVLKRFGETDPAKAYAKLRHAHLADLPIPRLDFSVAEDKRAHREIVDNVRKLLDAQAQNGGEEDLQIEWRLRQLWGISAEDGAYVNGEFYDLPKGQVVASLFPDGPPMPVAEP